MATITNVPHSFGISGSISYAALGSSSLIVLTARIGDAAKLGELEDGNGELIGFNKSREQKTLTLECVCSGSTKALAAGAGILPTIPSLVTLSGFAPTIGSGLNGNYIYKGGGDVQSGADVLKLTLPLVQEVTSSYTASQLTTAAP